MENSKNNVNGGAQGGQQQAQTVSDILNSDVAELFVRGVSSLTQSASELFNAYADEKYKKMCIPVLTMDNCLNWLKKQRAAYPDSGFFFISYTENTEPRNENDNFSVTVALLDANKKPIAARNAASPEKRGMFSPRRQQEQNLVCAVIPAGTLDGKLVRALNGEPSVLIKI